jgi:CHAD domain-containing protein
MASLRRFFIDEPDALAGVLPDGVRLESRGPVHRFRRTYLDTFDWRVHDAGGRLVAETDVDGTILRWLPGDGDPFAVAVRRMPRFARDLPAGHLHDRLAKALDIRALLPIAEADLHREALRAVDRRGNLVGLVTVETAQPTGSDGTPLIEPASSTVEVESIGFDRPAIALMAAFARVLEPAGDELTAWSRPRGREPGDYRSKPKLEVGRSAPAHVALRSILGQLRETCEANVAGVLADHDVEFLHDLRVSVRRARSAISQLKGVLPEGARDLASELKWLGGVTGPCRDLDVYLLELDASRAMLPEERRDDLEPLARHIHKARSRARQRVARALRSERFTRLLEAWSAVASDTAVSDAPHAERPIGGLAASRIRKAFKRILRRGEGLGDDPPPADLHRLRIDAKKLRYLLEFFGELFDSSRVDPLVKELKRLQDLLGGFNDMDVQQRHLREFADELKGDDAVPAATLLAMGRLEGALEHRQEEFRHGFGARFAAFSAPEVQDEFRAVFAKETAP